MHIAMQNMPYNKNSKGEINNMITHEEAINKVTDYIMDDMQYKDQWAEVNWMLSKIYPTKDFDRLLSEWNLYKDGKWRSSDD